MSEHVWMNWKRKLGSPTSSLDHSQEPRCCNRRASLRGEDVRARPLQWPKRPELRPMQGMHTLNSAFSSIDMQATIPEIDLSPSQGTEFGSTQSMPIGEQDSGSISSTVPPSFAC